MLPYALSHESELTFIGVGDAIHAQIEEKHLTILEWVFAFVDNLGVVELHLDLVTAAILPLDHTPHCVIEQKSAVGREFRDTCHCFLRKARYDLISFRSCGPSVVFVFFDSGLDWNNLFDFITVTHNICDLGNLSDFLALASQ